MAYSVDDFVGKLGALNPHMGLITLATVVAELCRAAGVLEEATQYVHSQIPDKELRAKKAELESDFARQVAEKQIVIRPRFSLAKDAEHSALSQAVTEVVTTTPEIHN